MNTAESHRRFLAKRKQDEILEGIALTEFKACKRIRCEESIEEDIEKLQNEYYEIDTNRETSNLEAFLEKQPLKPDRRSIPY